MSIDFIHPDLRSLALPIDSLHEDPRNANQHNDASRKAIAASFLEFGQRKTIVVRREGMIVEAGNGTLAALRAAGWTHLACVVCDDDEERATAYGLADNQAAKHASWNFDQLRVNVEETLASYGDVLGSLWSGDQLADILANKAVAFNEQLNTSLTQELPAPTPAPASAPLPDRPEDDQIPETPAEPITQFGEVVELGSHTLHCCDCMDLLRSLPDNSIDAIVTDPPYGLSPDGRARTWDEIEALRREGKGPKAGFMGSAWDTGVPGIRWARECLRVLKPGGYIVAFSATRTIHRLACAVEDAGFEIRDTIHWAYWSGFPKSLDVAKAFDREKFDRDQILEVTAWIKSARDKAGIKNADIDGAFGFVGMSSHWTSTKSQPSVPTLEQVPILLKVLRVVDPPPRIRELLLDLNAAKGEPGPNWWNREVVGSRVMPDSSAGVRPGFSGPAHSGAASGRVREVDITAPATDDARKWEGWGTALKPAIEPAVLARKPLSEATVAANVRRWGTGALNIEACRYADGDAAWPGPQDTDIENGRWPANIYACPKSSTRERSEGAEDGNGHPTVKPVRLMKWLVRLVTPAGGRVLEPFGGSGTTLVAAQGFEVIAAEREPKYCDIIRARITHALK